MGYNIKFIELLSWKLVLAKIRRNSFVHTVRWYFKLKLILMPTNTRHIILQIISIAIRIETQMKSQLRKKNWQNIIISSWILFSSMLDNVLLILCQQNVMHCKMPSIKQIEEKTFLTRFSKVHLLNKQTNLYTIVRKICTVFWWPG